MRTCVPKEYKEDVLASYHDSMITGHLGMTRTVDRISRRFYWPKMITEIQGYVRSCPSCQMRKPVPGKQAGLMMYIEVENPFERVGIDLLGPFPESLTGNKYAIVAIDYLTKWAETGALKTGTAVDVAQFMIDKIILRHGCPHTIISDRGKCFLAGVTQELLQMLETNHLTTTSYHPQTNGLCERLNHTLADMLSMYVNSDQKNWDEILPFVTFAYNTSKQDSTGYNPFYLIYGREAVLPTDAELGVRNNPSVENPQNKDYALRVINNLAEARKNVTDRMVVVHQRQKIVYDKNRRHTEYEIGDTVLIFKPFRTVGKAEKLLHRWLGPYRVLRQTSPLNYEVMLDESKTGKTDTVHVVAMKPFYPSTFENLRPLPESDVRRKPGRPNKVITGQDPMAPVLPTNVEIGSLPQTEVRRKPGRPKKVIPGQDPIVPVLPTITETGLLPQSEVRRKPGRPKKVVTIQVETPQDTNTPAEENLPTRRLRPQTRTLPRHLQFIQGLFLLMLFGLVFADSANENTVRFNKIASITVTNSEWIVITEITFDDVLQSINEFRVHLEDRVWNKTTMRRQMYTPGLKLHTQPTEIQKFLVKYAEERTSNALNTLNTIHTRLYVATNSIHSNHQKPRRAAIKAGGDVLRWLFGTATTKDLENINKKLKAMTKLNEEVVHSVEDQATIFKEGLLQTKLNTDILKQVKLALVSLDKDLESVKTEVAEITTDCLYTVMKIDLVFDQVHAHLNALEQYVDNLSMALNTLASERLPSQVFSPERLYKVLGSISEQLPRGWRLALETNPNHLWLFYQQATVKTATFLDDQKQKGLKLFIHIPVHEVRFGFNLYQVINPPIYNHNTTHGVQYMDLPDYLAVSFDQEQFMTLEKNEVEKCLKANRLWICPITQAISKIQNTETCIMSLFLNDEKQAKLCTQILAPWKGPYSAHLGENGCYRIKDQIT